MSLKVIKEVISDSKKIYYKNEDNPYKTPNDVVVLGSTGVVGRALIRLLQERKLRYYRKYRSDYDARYEEDNCFSEIKRDSVVVNLIAEKTTIALNKEKPATICENTLRTNMNVLKMCHNAGVKKLINIVSSCAYPGDCIEPMGEDYFWKGSPHESIRPHGLAKQAVYGLSQFYRQEFGLNVVCLAFNSIYGGTVWEKPETLKVLESLVKKIVDAKNRNIESVTLWGTGDPRREFLYVDDAAESILQAIKKYDDGELLNIGSGYDISIKDLAEGIKLAAGYKGEILWDTSKPDGQIRKLLSVEKMKTTLNWEPPTLLANGIQKTIEDFENYVSNPLAYFYGN